MKAKFESMLAKMPEAERKAFEARRKQDEAFFESIKNLPETERRQKMAEHRAKNPPPPMPGNPDRLPPPEAPGDTTDGSSASSGSSAGGGPGSGKVRIPPADARRAMDQQIANGQAQGGS